MLTLIGGVGAVVVGAGMLVGAPSAFARDSQASRPPSHPHQAPTQSRPFDVLPLTTVAFDTKNTEKVYSFSVLDPSARFRIQVEEHGVEDATVALNGVMLFGPDDFGPEKSRKDGARGNHGGSDRNSHRLERDITLQAKNRLTVTLTRAQRRGHITLHVVGFDSSPPTITARVDPPADADGWNYSSATVYFTCADATSGIAFCPEPRTVSSAGMGQMVKGVAVDRAGHRAETSLLLNIDNSEPGVFDVLPPTQVVSTKGKPAPKTLSFTANDTSIPYTIRIENWGVPAGEITLNGQKIFKPQDFPGREDWSRHARHHHHGKGDRKEKTRVMERVVRLGAQNKLGVTLFGPPGTYIMVWVYGMDTVGPTILGTADPEANSEGWNNSDVTVRFNCADASSGIASCSPPETLTAEGKGQVVTGVAADKAGHRTTTTVVVNIDKTEPVIASVLSPAPNTLGWSRLDTTVSFQCSDALSEVAKCSPPVVVNVEGGNQSISGTVMDKAGNSSSGSVVVALDKTPPTIRATAMPPPNEHGWNRDDVSLSYTCTDVLSGVASCSPGGIVSMEGGGQNLKGVSLDRADNQALLGVTLNIDKTPPVIQTTTTPAANANGWHKSSPTVAFSCSDTLSGVASCPDPITVAKEGETNVSASGEDVAGNRGTTSVAVHLDRTPPQIAFVSPGNGSAVATNPPPLELSVADESGIAQGSIVVTANGTVVNANCLASSGRITCSLPARLSGNSAAIEVRAEDLAGNANAASVAFDFDRDGDGIIDASDVFPDDPTESVDLDGDGIGNNADTDRDGDGSPNEEEIANGTDPGDPASFPDRVPPVFGADGPTQRSTELETVELSGTVTDQGSGVASVSAASDRYTGLGFSCAVSNGRWQTSIPLEIGTNRISVTAKDAAGNKSVLSFTIERDNPKSIVGLTVTYPLANAVVSQPSLVVRGTLRSDKPALQISVVVDGRPATLAATAQNTVFDFMSESVSLQTGVNTIYVTADVDGTKIQRSLIVVHKPTEQQIAPPEVSVLSPLSGSYLNQRSFFVAGRVTAAGGLKSLTINGAAVGYSDLQAPEYAFKELLTIPTGQSETTFTIRATDTTGQFAQEGLVYRIDDQAPVITLERALQAPPVENIANEQPYWLRGTVSDPGLSSFTINGTAVVVEPSETGKYRFDVPLKLGTVATEIRMDAFDGAGNAASESYLLRVQTETILTVISPADGTEYIYDGTATPVDVSVRVEATSVDNVKVVATLLAGDTHASRVELSGTGAFRSGVVNLPDITGNYALRIEAVDTAGKVLASAVQSLSSKSVNQIPVAVTRVEPTADEASVEPNAFVSVFFNRPIDVTDVAVEVHETALGWTYEDRDELGTDPLNAKGYQLVQVNRSNEAVEGKLSLLPNQKVIAFYPSREFAYGAQVFIDVSYRGESVARTQFATRALPTFVAGTVVDQLGQAVAGVEVALPALNRTARTNKDGAFEFGQGDTASEALLGGRHKLVINPGLKDKRFGSRALWVTVTPGRRADLKTVKIPVIAKELGFVPVTGRSRVSLLNGSLKLDLSDADILFQDGSRDGNVQAQLISYTKVPYPVDAIALPAWMFILQPADTAVEGNIQVDMEIPMINLSYNHIPPDGTYAILTGVDPESYRVVPAGVGQVISGRVKSVGATHFKSIDAFGYMVLPPTWKERLDGYAKGETSFAEVLSMLSTLRSSTQASQ